jgi:transketolase
VLQKLNVKLIGIGANDYFKFLGPSHTTSGIDIKIMHEINMPIWYAPDFENWIASDEAGYIRL